MYMYEYTASITVFANTRYMSTQIYSITIPTCPWVIEVQRKNSQIKYPGPKLERNLDLNDISKEFCDIYIQE